MKKLLLSCSLLALADDSKHSRDLKDKTGSEDVDVIVQYAVAPRQRHKDRIAGHGGQVKSDLQVVKAVSASLPASKLRALSDDPDVSFVTPDRTVTGSLNYVTAAAGAGYAWQLGYDGIGIGVAVIGSGTNTSGSDFNTTVTSKTSRVLYSQNFTSLNGEN